MKYRTSLARVIAPAALIAASVSYTTQLVAQTMGMDPMQGMSMPMPGQTAAKPKPSAAKKPPKAPPPAKARAQPPDQGSMPGMDMNSVQMKGKQADDTGAMTMTGRAGQMVMKMSGAFGSYSSGRDASGTSWQPDVSEHGGLHIMRGNWMFMAHALLNTVYDWQSGARGDEKGFVSGMAMIMAQRGFSNGDTVNLRAMLSPDAFMGKGGYPLLLATGETADGSTPLIDRQHPHDLFMELSGSYSHKLSSQDSVFVYAGLPGEPAFGPPAFMHRLSALDSPEAPVSHHWLDSTHITFGVVTIGFVHDNWKIEVSGFRGREPDQNRFDIEEPKLDSSSVRLNWNPGERWSLQASWADVHSPEQLEPDQNQKRWSASAIYTMPLGEAGWWSTTGAFGRKELSDGPALDAWLLESAVHPNRDWTVWLRAENVETNELDLTSGAVRDVSKASVGVIRDFTIADHVVLGAGALYARNWIPGALSASYGDEPEGGMIFLRLKII